MTEINISTLIWENLVEYDSNYSPRWDCDCDLENGFCTCGKVHPVVNYIFYDLVCENIVRILAKSEIYLSDIKLYCLDRIIRKTIKVSDIKAYGITGYYGEEVECQLEEEAKSELTSLIEALINNEERVVIESVLILEYGYVLNAVANKGWVLKEVDISKIHSPYTRVSNKIISTYSGKETVLCKTVNEDYYRLIDGNHRFAAAKQNKMKKRKILTTI